MCDLSVMGDGLGRPGVNLFHDLPCPNSHVFHRCDSTA